MDWTYPAMHVLLAGCAVVVAGLAAWLAVQVVSSGRRRAGRDDTQP